MVAPWGCSLRPDGSSKQVNDRWGHEAGDCAFAHRPATAASGLGHGHRLPPGGDEFVLLLPECNFGRCAADCHARAGRDSRAVLGGTGGSAAGYSISGGVSMFPEHGTNFSDFAAPCRQRPVPQVKEAGTRPWCITRQRRCLLANGRTAQISSAKNPSPRSRGSSHYHCGIQFHNENKGTPWPISKITRIEDLRQWLSAACRACFTTMPTKPWTEGTNRQRKRFSLTTLPKWRVKHERCTATTMVEASMPVCIAPVG